MILVLLFVQANCDLSLPQYTSNIVNVGIQQGGIEDAAADTLQEETMEKLFLFMDEGEQTLVKSCYTCLLYTSSPIFQVFGLWQN